MVEVSAFRLHVLRGTYLLIAIGLGIDVVPGLFRHPESWTLMRGVVCSLLSTVALLAVLGVRSPLRMLPLLLLELLWKLIWVIAFGIPLWSVHKLDAAAMETLRACLMGLVIFPVVIPWPYVVANYVRPFGGPWNRSPQRAATE